VRSDTAASAAPASSVGAAGCGRWPRRALLVLSLVLVVLSVVGMHQLSVGHTIATTSSELSRPAGSGEHGDRHGQSPAGAVAGPADATAASPALDAPVPANSCPDCDHTSAFGSCLLALTLLVLGWLLRPPPQRSCPPFLLPRSTAALVANLRGRLVPPLTLTELSLRRT